MCDFIPLSPRSLSYVKVRITQQKAPNVLIAYFSEPENVDTTGVDAVSGDLFHIETTAEYPSDHEPLVGRYAAGTRYVS